MVADDIQRVLEVLKDGLASAEHQAFVGAAQERELSARMMAWHVQWNIRNHRLLLPNHFDQRQVGPIATESLFLIYFINIRQIG
jgi:hypothetical protein